ncbi:MAG: SIS domain-containing protein [Alphaproteobacteria bacterium]|nr:SIS domain-containing protein [Alphaproteobacteria bacterium]
MNLSDDRRLLVEQVIKSFETSIDVKRKCIGGGCADIVVEMAQCVAEAISRGGKLLLCGNGGSAADAQHLAAELVVRLRPHVSREGVAAMSLAMDSSTLTACGNDFAFDEIFSRPLQSMGRSGDVLLGITTSGNSVNVVRAFKCAQAMGIHALGFLGNGGGSALQHCDMALVVPSDDTAAIQEAHITAGHALMVLVEDLLLRDGHISRMEG